MRQLHEAFDSDLPVILVSACQTDAFDRTAGLMLGADDYVSKPLDAGELDRARQAVATPRSAAHQRDRERQNGRQEGRSQDPGLSRREREILSLLADGRTQGQIATELVISPKTVATHIQHILSKLGVHTRAQAVALAFRRGLVDSDVRAHALALLTALEMTRGGFRRLSHSTMPARASGCGRDRHHEAAPRAARGAGRPSPAR